MPDGTCIAVLGMHRSGTSALAGSLRDAGLYLGRVLDQQIRTNRKGLQEAPALLYMHEDLLQKNGGSWQAPPENLEWGPLHKAVRDLFIESRTDVPLWGFKDPRTLLTLEGWLEVLPSMRCAAIFRHPAEVAASLNHRNGFTFDKGFHLWEIYNRRLIEFQALMKFPIVEFTGDEEHMRGSLNRLVSQLGLDPASAETFYEADLRVHDRVSVSVPSTTMEIYERLKDMAL